MVFEKGLIVETTSEKMAKNINEAISFNKKKKVKNAENVVRTIAEFAIGTNKKASLVGSMICDEKAYGTCHIAIGANKHIGGKTQCYGHFDNVIVKPSIWFDNKKIMEKGKLLL
jgi:leucyl aminopeptidase (aminopeptidase T)